MRWFISTFARLGVVAMVFASAPRILPAQTPDAGNYSPAQYELEEFKGIMVPMRDGVYLSVDLYRPRGAGVVPGILASTPYDKSGVRDRARWFAVRGYAVVVADVRGRYNSEGEWDPFNPTHKLDGYDLVEWIGSQAWSTGRVGMIGGSYLGWTQWWTASQAPPSLKAIAPAVVPADGFRNFPYQEGVLVGVTLDWGSTHGGRTQQITAVGPYGGYTNTRYDDFLHTPYVEIAEKRGLMSAPWLPQWIRQNRSTDEYWSAISHQNEAVWSRVAVPSLNMTGWHDAAFPGSVINYVGMSDHGATPEAARPFLMIGPWPHGLNQRVVGNFDYGADAVIDLDGYITRWFDYWLKGIDNGVTRDPRVHVFVMGDNEWVAADDWPLPGTDWTRYYLRSGGSANSLNGDGVLTLAPSETEVVDTYIYDPANPTLDPFTGAHTEEGAVDARLPAIGKEVLVYDTPPLEEDVRVIGPIEAKLYAATSARDTDWMVRLVDVHPNGYAALLAEGVMRARNRNPSAEGRYDASQFSMIEPNQVYEYTIEFWRPTGNVFRQGHRIRVEISSSYYPFYLRNFNTGADNVGLVHESEAVVATQRIYHGGEYPSHILLPVIPAPN